ncbi:MAG: tRNA pseudouridine(55) synthase TruB [Verrucomicrobiales bacterium]|nr:tRNA pseudouridine(55) synthase TruB [Verrucomicrobiales bacterium]
MENVDGVLLVDKDPDMTSHDVVSVARRTLGQKKIGHCGTLDPMATGLLILTLGRGTKIQDLLMAEDKEYVGTVRLGEETTTQDKEGEIVLSKDVPELDEHGILSVLKDFTGDFHQTPPMVSAIKKDGVPLYKLARQGKEVKREPRLVHVYDYELTSLNLPEFDFRVICSKGFYVRTYAHEIGMKIGCGAHLSSLRRTKSGKFSADGAITFDELKNGTRESVAERALSLSEVSKLRGV